MLNLMTDVKFRPCQVMDLLEQLARGAEKLSFKRKDDYNWLNGMRSKRIKAGDVNTSLSLFESMKIKDKEFFYKYTVNEQMGTFNAFFGVIELPEQTIDYSGMS